MNNTAHILLACSSETIAAQIIEKLNDHGFAHQYKVVNSPESVIEVFDNTPWDMVVCHDTFAHWNPDQALQIAQKIHPIPFILISDSIDAKNYESLIASGIHDIIPSSLERLIPLTREIIAKTELKESLYSAKKEIERNRETQDIVNNLLHLSLTSASLTEVLETFIKQIVSLPWLGVKPKGAVFLVDDGGANLVLQAQKGLHPALIKECAQVPYGKCLCGRCAATMDVVFADCLDDQHTNIYDGIEPHGHYCIPLITSHKELIGVFTLYTKEGCIREKRAEETLKAAASAVAGIIERLRTEDIQRESEGKYRAITDTAKDAIIMLDSNGKIIFWNPAAQRIFGYSTDEVLGKDCHDLLMPQIYVSAFQKGFEHYKKTGQGMAIGETIEITALRKGGEEFPVEMSLAAYQAHNTWQSIGIIREISKRKAAAKEKEKLQEEVRQARNLEAIATLAGGIAHDFNNILAAIFGYADMAMEGLPEESSSQKDLEQVLIAATRAKELVQQLLAFSRQTEQAHEPIQVHLLIKEGLKFLRSSIPSTIKISWNISPDSGSVIADPGQIHQILINLCTNSFQAMRHTGGELQVDLEPIDVDTSSSEAGFHLEAGPYVRLTVHDTGPGMDAALIERIFEPYFTTKDVDEGSGLGLSVVHGIVLNLGGATFAESVPQEGTTFKVYLPRYEKSRQNNALEGLPVPRGSERLLFVDDEIALAKLGEKLLERLGYQVTTHTDSVKAWEDIRQDPDKYDLVITDMTMPDMTGLDLAKKIFSLKPDFPIILTTGFSELITEEQVKELGIKEFIMKPIIPKEFGVIIRNILDQEKKQEN